MPLRPQIERIVEQMTAKLEDQYRDDAELVLTGVIVRARNPDGPVSTHYRFQPSSHREVIELLDEVRRTLIEEAY